MKKTSGDHNSASNIKINSRSTTASSVNPSIVLVHSLSSNKNVFVYGFPWGFYGFPCVVMFINKKNHGHVEMFYGIRS